MSKSKKIVVIALIVILSGVFIIGLSVYFYYKTPTITIDYSKSEGEISYGAIGWLYGMSEPDVPAGDLLVPLKPQIAAVKTADGLQHPMGDVMQVGDYFIENGGKYIFIYMQDIYAEWYYEYRGQQDYLNKVSIMMDKLMTHDKKNLFIYCPFNENDNGKWYGDFKQKASREAFYKDWIEVYKLIKEKEPNAYIAGPGFMKYNKKYIKEYLEFCKNNSCLPNMMVWHELQSKSYKDYENNYKTYREIEKELEISPLRICISEYGRMKDNGVPGQMIQFISMFEKTKVDACIAYWRLANNLSDIVADNNTPSAAWWLYYWYSQMSGDTYAVKRKVLNKDGFNGFSTYDQNTDLFTVLVGGSNSKSKVILDNVSAKGYKEGDIVYISIDSIDYVGLSTDVLEPVKLSVHKSVVKNNKIEISIDNISKTKGYKIEVSKKQKEEFELKNKTIRYEAEDGKVEHVSSFKFRKEYVVPKKSLTYASSEELVSNIWRSGNVYELNLNVKESGLYKLDICYRNGYRKNGDADSRTIATGYLKINKSEQKIVLENTISHETTKVLTVMEQLNAGDNLLKLYKGDGSGNNISFDFIDVTKVDDVNSVINSHRIDNNRAFVVAPGDGYYLINTKEEIELNNIKIGNSDIIYLKKGINIFNSSGDFSIAKQNIAVKNIENTYDNTLSKYSWQIEVEKKGLYAISFNYSNNEEFGSHEYNVQHVERYASILVNSQFAGMYYFRNTFSWDNIKSRTIYVELTEGVNVIEAINDRSYIWNERTPYMPDFKTIKVASFVLN